MNARKVRGRRKQKEGDVFQVELGDGRYAFGIVAAGDEHAFFDFCALTIPRVDEVVATKVAFRIWGPADAISSGRWKVLGNIPLSGSLAEPGSYRNQPVGSNQLYLYRGGSRTPATVEDVKDLEATAWWNAEHVEQRLRDHFAGKPNALVERLKVIRKYDPNTGEEIR